MTLDDFKREVRRFFPDAKPTCFYIRHVNAEFCTNLDREFTLWATYLPEDASWRVELRREDTSDLLLFPFRMMEKGETLDCALTSLWARFHEWSGKRIEAMTLDRAVVMPLPVPKREDDAS